MPGPDLHLLTSLRDAYEASRAVRTPEDLDAVLEHVASLVADELGWGTVVINAHRRAWDDFQVAVVHGSDAARDMLLGTTQTWADWAPLLAPEHARRGAFFVPAEQADVATEGLLVFDPGGPAPDTPDGWHPHDMVLVLMRGGDGEVIGVLSVDQPVSRRRPTDQEIEALVAIADIAGAALHQAREAARDAEHRGALEHLLAVSSTIADARSRTSVLQAVCEGIRDALGFEHVVVALADEHNQIRAAAQAGWDVVPSLAEIPLHRLAPVFVPEHEVHGCHLLEREEALSLLGLKRPSYASRCNGRGPWAWHNHWLLVPLRAASGEVLGFIWPEDPRDRLCPDVARLQALRLFADQAQAALEAAHHYEHALHGAEHDGLTGLPNRGVLLDRVRHALVRLVRGERTLAVLFVDIDRFKRINDTYGHDVGDEILRVVASRIDDSLRPGDTVARLGGDEFVILCEDLRDAGEAEDIARRLRARLAHPMEIASGSLHITASVGIALPSEAGEDARALLRDADIAMYRAKAGGGDADEVASPALRARASERARLERDLDDAITRGEVSLEWQPIVDLLDGRIVRLEALLRWDHPVLGRIPPLEFVPIAEESGAIVELGRWVLSAACSQWAAWRDRHGPATPAIAVNLSPRQLGDLRLVDSVARLLSRHDMPGAALAVEITEGALLEPGPVTARALDGLRELGVEIDLDDFGTGFSSLSSLERFPVDGLKIDRSFVSGPGADTRAGAIVEALLALARSLGVRVTAEGVETDEQLRWLTSAGCQLAQGYRFARPQPADAVEALLSPSTSRRSPTRTSRQSASA